VHHDQHSRLQVRGQLAEQVLERLDSAGGSPDHYQIAMGHSERPQPGEMFRDTVEISVSGKTARAIQPPILNLQHSARIRINPPSHGPRQNGDILTFSRG
jgi:hypothetical protein